MKPKDIAVAEAEAKRFLARVTAAKDAFEYRKFNTPHDGGYWSNTDTKATAALRRASLDLTRALAAMRKP